MICAFCSHLTGKTQTSLRGRVPLDVFAFLNELWNDVLSDWKRRFVVAGCQKNDVLFPKLRDMDHKSGIYTDL